MSLSGFPLFDVNSDGIGDNAAIDQDGDGYRETLLFDTNGDGIADQVQVDTDKNGVTDTDSADSNLDGTLDMFATDVDRDGTYESISIDRNFDGVLEENYEDANENHIEDRQEALPTMPSDGGGGNLTDTLLKLLQNPNLDPKAREEAEKMLEIQNRINGIWL